MSKYNNKITIHQCTKNAIRNALCEPLPKKMYVS